LPADSWIGKGSSATQSFPSQNSRVFDELFETRVSLLPFQHPDGFCNWPSKYTTHSVAASPFRGGKGDVVREVSDAAKEQGIGFGLYLAPWDKHERTYGNTRLYNEFYMGQLTELMTQ
jgi:alpha-L-fucosidase